MVTSKKPTPQERKEMTQTLRVKHQPVFDKLGIQDAEYIPKMAHFKKNLTGLHMGFFESELSKGCDIYTEKVSMDLEPEDPNRTLYRLRYNSHFKEEYPTEETDSGYTRYFVPVDELEEVKIGKAIRVLKGTQKEEQNIVLPFNPNIDAPMDQFTIRDYAAIHLRVPVSQKEWLNDIIKQK